MKLREQPCERCGWKFPGFHVCVDLSQPVAPDVLKKHIPDRPRRNPGMTKIVRTEEHLQHLADGRNHRWERHWEETRERDVELVRRYMDGLGFRPLAIEYGISYQTARAIVKRAVARGEATIRPAGTNLRWTQKKENSNASL